VRDQRGPEGARGARMRDPRAEGEGRVKDGPSKGVSVPCFNSI
jgi:hypothetical protein